MTDRLGGVEPGAFPESPRPRVDSPVPGRTMSQERDPRPRGGSFPATRWSAIEAVRSADPEERRRALDRLISVYWRPVYKYIRARWRRSTEDAQDLTQEFFASLVDRGTLAAYDPGRARLRTFLRSCIDALVSNAERDARRQKRGGGAAPLSLEFELAEGELARTGLPSAENLEGFFEREWIRSLFTAAVDELRSSCTARGKPLYFALFERYDLEEHAADRPTYAALAREFGIAPTDVTNHLAAARREFRRITLELLRQTTATDEEFRREARSLLGHAPE
jgi:RNA polymerase sigma factor (sigma-70 family)